MMTVEPSIVALARPYIVSDYTMRPMDVAEGILWCIDETDGAPFMAWFNELYGVLRDDAWHTRWYELLEELQSAFDRDVEGWTLATAEGDGACLLLYPAGWYDEDGNETAKDGDA